ncbi:BnaA09g06970D [Brassica napus]|uniref:BnaA09g06970D protein n=1 Tax=Brassica napus TaxID=3708 RepID=A0A078G225_BRANA|nr:BnaA09g06970D [Brassica napus]
MGNCATKPKVLKDSEEDMVPVERDMAAPSDHNKATAEKSQNNAPNEAVDAAATARRSEKGKEFLVEDDVKKEHGKSQSLSPLFHEDKVIGKEVTDITPTKPETNDKTGASSKVTKLDDASPLMATNVKAPESFDVQTRNDLEVKIPKDSQVKTPETPKAKEAEEQEVHFSENWEVKFPEELEINTASGVFEDKNVPENSEVHAPPELSDIKVTKESNFPEVLEDKNVLKTDEVKAAESELLKVSEVKSSEDLEIKVPKVFEVKNPGTSNVKVETKVKTDQEASQVNTGEDTEVPEFLDAQEKIDKAEAQILEDIKVTEDKEIMMSENEEEKGLSIEKKVKESTLSDLDSK